MSHRVFKPILIVLALAALAVPASRAGDWEGKLDGPFMQIDLIDVQAYGNDAYREYLGKGYVPLLEMAKAAGHVLDYGVLEYQTGSSGDGNVVIWWTTQSMAAMQAANELIEKKAQELYTAKEWKEMTDAMAKVRTPLSTNIARAVTWHQKAAEGGGEESAD